MDVSVVIPLFNGEEYVRETLDSVLAQTLAPREIMVVDDGSTDASPTIAEEYPEVQLLTNPGDGSNAARNYGFHHTSADAVAFLDQDDLWHPQHLQHLSEALSDRPDSPAAFAGKATFYDDETPQYSLASPDVRQYDPWEDFPKNTLGEPVLALIRSEALRSADGWSSEYEGCSDYHLWLKLALQGPLVVSEGVTAGHRIHGNSYGDKLRKRKVTQYYERRIRASEDVLDRRRENGLSVENYESLLEAHRATKQILQFLLGEDCKLTVAAHQIDENLSQASQESTIQMWDVLRWYSGPHIEEVGIHRFAARVLELVDRWPDTDSRFRNLLRDWAFKRSPARELIRRYPWGTSCWSHLVRRGYQKMGARI
ncbi:glycosyltransferase involved in cell wall biosynthesis [Salinibacter ruber]|uniref:glycosyltransferase family 2 protein n=1 Tax=Salinibacter ruber TaxID=146919 RepID=UPI00216A35E7|nr:glycosyltransferase [Salinibacter ruber]MCS3700200.1 glycosyltransferase involved in cell wall biosynthesis [Salinibacter ruber]